MARQDPNPLDRCRREDASFIASLSPSRQLAVLRLIADEFSWSDDAYMAIAGAADQLETELLAENARANGYGAEFRA